MAKIEELKIRVTVDTTSALAKLDQLRSTALSTVWTSTYIEEGIPQWVPVWCYRIWRKFVPFNPNHKE